MGQRKQLPMSTTDSPIHDGVEEKERERGDRPAPRHHATQSQWSEEEKMREGSDGLAPPNS